MPFKKITGSEIDQNMSDGITILNFYANWCGPCKMMAPIFEKIGQKADVTVLKVEVDDAVNQDAAKKYRVQGIPATFIFKNKQQKFHHVGYLDQEALEKELSQL